MDEYINFLLIIALLFYFSFFTFFPILILLFVSANLCPILKSSTSSLLVPKDKQMLQDVKNIDAFCLFLDPFADVDDDRAQEANNNIRKHNQRKLNLDLI